MSILRVYTKSIWARRTRIGPSESSESNLGSSGISSAKKIKAYKQVPNQSRKAS
jgi:hypothetical protein